MLSQTAAPSRRTDDVGRPLPGSSFIAEHPDLASYRRVMSIRHQGCVEDGDKIGAIYHGRLVRFVDAHLASQLFIVWLSTERECYEFLYFPREQTALFFPARYLEGRKIESV